MRQGVVYPVWVSNTIYGEHGVVDVKCQVSGVRFRSSVFCGSVLWSLFGHMRNINPKCAAPARYAFHLYGPVVRLDDFLDDGKP